jgi:hypothetical protein
MSTTIELSVTEMLSLKGPEDNPASTALATDRSFSDDRERRYCSACRQKDCCELPDERPQSTLYLE